MITAPTFCGYPTERHPGNDGMLPNGSGKKVFTMKQFKEKLIVGIDHGYGVRPQGCCNESTNRKVADESLCLKAPA